MSEIRVGENESLENAPRDSSVNAPVPVLWPRQEKESTMRSPASRERRRLRQQESVKY